MKITDDQMKNAFTILKKGCLERVDIDCTECPMNKICNTTGCYFGFLNINKGHD